MSKPIQKISPSCPLHTVSFDIWPLLSLSSSYVYSFCRKELFPVEQKSLWERQKWSSVSFSSQLFIQEFRKRLRETQKQCKWSRLWKASSWTPSATAKRKGATSRQTWSTTVPRGQQDPLHGTHGGRGTGPSPDQHCANILTVVCTEGSSEYSAVSLLLFSWWRSEQERGVCMCVCTCAYNPKEV